MKELGFSRERSFLAAFALIVGVLTVISDGGKAVSGDWIALVRALIGLLGITAGILIVVRPFNGWKLAAAWAAVQIPYYAWTPTGGSPTAQVLQAPLGFLDRVEVNGRVTSFTHIAVNLVGAVLLIWLWNRKWKFGHGVEPA